VPKLKSHKGTQKRIGVTGSGKPIRVKAWRGHHLEIKSSRRTRRYAGKALMKDVHAEQVRRLLQPVCDLPVFVGDGFHRALCTGVYRA